MVQMAAFGILDKIKLDSVPEKLSDRQEDPLTALTMEQFVLAIIFLGFGFCLAAIAFVIEILIQIM